MINILSPLFHELNNSIYIFFFVIISFLFLTSPNNFDLYSVHVFGYCSNVMEGLARRTNKCLSEVERRSSKRHSSKRGGVTSRENSGTTPLRLVPSSMNSRIEETGAVMRGAGRW